MINTKIAKESIISLEFSLEATTGWIHNANLESKSIQDHVSSENWKFFIKTDYDFFYKRESGEELHLRRDNSLQLQKQIQEDYADFDLLFAVFQEVSKNASMCFPSWRNKYDTIKIRFSKQTTGKYTTLKLLNEKQQLVDTFAKHVLNSNYEINTNIARDYVTYRISAKKPTIKLQDQNLRDMA